MQNILITGGAGFIGSNFVHFLLKGKEPIRVINLDVLNYAGNVANLSDLIEDRRHIFIHGDICDQGLLNQIFIQYEIDTVVHFAAETHVDRSIHKPDQFIQTNIIGTYNLLETAKKHWKGYNKINEQLVRFHHISTDEVFGSLEMGDPAFSETTPYSPNSPYSASKASSDHLVRAYYHTYGLPISITNCTNNYGPYQFPEKLIPLIIFNALKGEKLPVYGNGTQVRDWLYVEDHCEAIYQVLTYGRVGETYGIGGNKQYQNIEIVKAICNIMDDLLPKSRFVPHESLITYVQDRPGHDKRYAMDISKIHEELNWKPQQSLDSGLEKTIRWYLNNQEWLESIQKRNDYQNWLNSHYHGKSGDVL